MTESTTLTIVISKNKITIDNEMMREGTFLTPCYALRYLETRMEELMK